jgi:hypothetical protein
VKPYDRKLSVICFAVIICLLFTTGLVAVALFSGCGGGTSGSGGVSSASGGNGTGNNASIVITAPFPAKTPSLTSLVRTLLGKEKKSRFIPPNVDLYVVKVCHCNSCNAIIDPLQFNRPSGGGDVTTNTPEVPVGLV